MLCCTECFEYDSVKNYIIQDGVGRGYCDFCEEDRRYCIDPEELDDLFRPLISMYSRVDEWMPTEILKNFDGDDLVDKLRYDWAPFTNDFYENVANLLEAIFGTHNPMDDDGIDLENWVEIQDDWYGITDEPSYRLQEDWEKFCDELIYKNRFFPQNIVKLDFLHEFAILRRTIGKDQFLYRSRKTKNRKKIAPKNMGTPPSHLTQHGRANPKGIPYLYLATDMETALHEIRPKTTDLVTIGHFKVLDDLEIFNLSAPRISDPLALGDDLDYAIRYLSFFRMLGHELSKPIKPEERDLLYLPSQYLCEFLKKEGYDGVAYKSGFGPGKNLALFSSSKVKCTRTHLYKINAQPQGPL